MKKVTGMVVALLMAGVLLSGCYSKTTCDPQPMSPMYKGEG